MFGQSFVGRKDCLHLSQLVFKIVGLFQNFIVVPTQLMVEFLKCLSLLSLNQIILHTSLSLVPRSIDHLLIPLLNLTLQIFVLHLSFNTSDHPNHILIFFLAGIQGFK